MAAPVSSGETSPPGQAAPPPFAQYASPGLYMVQRANGMAITSVVCAAIGFVIPVIGGVLGIIFGIIGLQKTRNPAVGGKGMAITGISLGAASILLSGCMMSILLPSLNRAR